jgi:transcriptional regulator with XRE-family HTH domain
VSTLAERLDQALKHAGITAYVLAKDTSTDQGSISRALSGQSTNQKHATLAKWAKRCGVRAEWLSMGTGPMLEASSPIPRLRERAEWHELVQEVRLSHPDFGAADIDLVGEMMYDDPKLWPGRLDAPAVAELVRIRRDWLARETARRRK